MGGTGSGRKRQPVELAKLKGTMKASRYRGVAADGGDKVGSLQACYSVPLYREMSQRARDVYRSVCRMLLPLKMLTFADLQQLIVYGNAWDGYLDCVADIRKNGRYTLRRGPDGEVAGTVENPSVRHLKIFYEQIVKIGQNYGLTPVDRQRIKARADGDDPKLQIVNLVMKGEGYVDGPEDQ
jgi:P27 family predicted phage terminase small subunit